MRILYIAKHGSGGNDDEGAIVYALAQLGHSVLCVAEDKAVPSITLDNSIAKSDLLLFHKWIPYRRFDTPTVFWYFDLVDYPRDRSLMTRCTRRKRWMSTVVPLVDLGFCTDGDWVVNGRSSKLVWLSQGADERVVGRELADHQTTPLLFTGLSSAGGNLRASWVRRCEKEYGDRLTYINRGVYRERLREVVGTTKVVLCPDHPTTDRYWSNRVYNMAGFGGCILHPRCSELEKHFIEGEEILFYNRDDPESMDAVIDLLLDPDSDELRMRLGVCALDRVTQEHLYRHRCETLLNTVNDRLGVR